MATPGTSVKRAIDSNSGKTAAETSAALTVTTAAGAAASTLTQFNTSKANASVVAAAPQPAATALTPKMWAEDPVGAFRIGYEQALAAQLAASKAKASALPASPQPAATVSTRLTREMWQQDPVATFKVAYQQALANSRKPDLSTGTVIGGKVPDCYNIDGTIYIHIPFTRLESDILTVCRDLSANSPIVMALPTSRDTILNNLEELVEPAVAVYCQAIANEYYKRAAVNWDDTDRKKFIYDCIYRLNTHLNKGGRIILWKELKKEVEESVGKIDPRTVFLNYLKETEANAAQPVSTAAAAVKLK